MAECNFLYERNAPKIYTTLKAIYKMRYYIDNTDKEIGWLGYVKKIEEDTYLIEDVFLLKQEVHSATTEIDPEALATMATNLIKQGAEGIALYNKIRMWGHSHVNMSTGASKQDDDQMDEFATSDFYIRLIGNKQGEWNVCLYDYTNNILWSGLQLLLYYTTDVNDEDLKKEIEENVKEKTTLGFNTSRVNHYGDYYRKFSRYDDYDDYGSYYERYYDRNYSSKANNTTTRLREEKEEEEKEETPYEIEGEVTKEDFRNMKRYYSSDEDQCLFMATASTKEIDDAIYEDYGIHLPREVLDDFQNDMVMIWANKYSDKKE